jgi:hypothetical protein
MNQIDWLKVWLKAAVAFLVSFTGSALMTGTVSNWRLWVLAIAFGLIQAISTALAQMSNPTKRIPTSLDLKQIGGSK